MGNLNDRQVKHATESITIEQYQQAYSKGKYIVVRAGEVVSIESEE